MLVTEKGPRLLNGERPKALGGGGYTFKFPKKGLS